MPRNSSKHLQRDFEDYHPRPSTRKVLQTTIVICDKFEKIDEV